MWLSLLAGVSIGVLYWIGWAIIVVFAVIGIYNIIRRHVPMLVRVKRLSIVLVILVIGVVYMQYIGKANTLYCKSLDDKMKKKEPFVTVCTIGINGCDTGMVKFLTDVKQRNYGVIYVGWGYMIIEEGSLNESRFKPSV